MSLGFLFLEVIFLVIVGIYLVFFELGLVGSRCWKVREDEMGGIVRGYVEDKRKVYIRVEEGLGVILREFLILK